MTGEREERPVGGTKMEREIREQPEALGRVLEEGWSEARTAASALRERGFRSAMLAARGTSDNAALYAKYLFEEGVVPPDRQQPPIPVVEPGLVLVEAGVEYAGLREVDGHPAFLDTHVVFAQLVEVDPGLHLAHRDEEHRLPGHPLGQRLRQDAHVLLLGHYQLHPCGARGH